MAVLPLRREQPIQLDFQVLGIPEAAEIEEIVMTPSGSAEGLLHPVFLHAPRIGRPASEKPVIYPVPIGSGADESEVNVLVVWRPASAAADAAQDTLLAGVRSAHSSDSLGAIISSNAAMEIALGLAMTTWLETRGIGRKRSKEFLDSNATYGCQLAVLLPVAAATVGLPPLPEPARAALARLRGLRNDVAHGGVQAATITDADIAEGLAGAAVGVAYCEALLARLS